jgi:hypothetical protein
MNGRLLSIILIATASLAPAGVILQVTSGTGFATESFGESFTTPSGGPWNSITFNFYSDVPAVTPAAAGNAFLLTQEYLGTPSGLSAATPGFLAESVSISGGVYIFNPSVVLDPNTEYWLYEDTLMTSTGSGTGGSAAGQAYFSDGTSSFSVFDGGQLANFTLSSSSVPEPSTLGLSAVGLIALALCVRRRRIAN